MTIEQFKRIAEMDNTNELDKYIIANGITDPKTLNIALVSAINARSYYNIMYLIKKGADLNCYDRPLYDSPLIHVLKYFEFDEITFTIVNTMVDYGAKFTDNQLKTEVDIIVSRFISEQLKDIAQFYDFILDNHKWSRAIMKILLTKTKTHNLQHQSIVDRIMTPHYFTKEDVSTFRRIYEKIGNPHRRSGLPIRHRIRTRPWRASF